VEKDGTFVNTDGIHQPIRAAFAPRGQSRPDWRILADLLARVGSPVPYFTAGDVRRELDALTERIA
jgi:predicted molibdopterin-dependent oxidoreductase YjgC